MKIILEDKAYQKIMWWVRKASGEVSGLGTVEIRDGVFYVTDAMLLPQKNGKAHTDIEPEDVCRLMYERRNDKGSLQYWWHSHADMGVFWSKTDTDTMSDIAKDGWFINTVFNKKYERRSAFVSGSPVPIFIDEVETAVFRELDAGAIKAMDDEFNVNVDEKPVYHSKTSIAVVQEDVGDPLDLWNDKESRIMNIKEIMEEYSVEAATALEMRRAYWDDWNGTTV